jgi:hypothetical protein
VNFLIVLALVRSYNNYVRRPGSLSTTIIQWLPLICPVVMMMISQIALKSISNPLFYIGLTLQLWLTLIWCFRVAVLKENYTHVYVSLSTFMALIRPFAYLILNLLIMFNIDTTAYMCIALSHALI